MLGSDAPVRRILVVEADPQITVLLQATFSRMPYEVLTVSDGRAAVEAVAESQPDLVLLDAHMPYLNGYEVCRLIKSKPESAHIPIIFLSCAAQACDRLKGLEAGAYAYLTKPFSPIRLVQTVEEALREQALAAVR